MLINETVSKLNEMRMGVMAAALSAQLNNPQHNALSFEERLSLLVDAEWSSRKSSRLHRLILNAGYSIPGASIEDVSYAVERQLNKSQVPQIAR